VVDDGPLGLLLRGDCASTFLVLLPLVVVTIIIIIIMIIIIIIIMIILFLLLLHLRRRFPLHPLLQRKRFMEFAHI